MASPIAKTAYFFNCTALFQGLGNLVWMPLTNKYGRRPVYIVSFTIYLITATWCCVEKEYANFLVARIVIGFAAGAAECLAPITISDVWQLGLCFFAGVIGALLGIFFGGNLSDWVADYFTKCNGGIREPEMRLPAIMIINFSITQATNVSLVYTIDSYRPIAGEIVVTQLAFKSAFGFLLGFYTNPWVDKHGYDVAYGEMAAICGGVLIFWVPLFVLGKKLRQKTSSWGIMKHARWNIDREVGE
ncbi:hypothetical protein QQZ08_006249 [Neonectria magnoliae]|uniref:Major facilitator superfamily (MFS) profile domain-containing protein n=1 Tax=Neonectria magnoliae TaxID=2732573 RepID=A0ABR1I2Y3_9HYPO